MDIIIDGHLIDRDQLKQLVRVGDDFLKDAAGKPPSPPRILFLVDPVAEFLESREQIKAVDELRQLQIDDYTLQGTWADARDLYDQAGNRVRAYATLIVDKAKADAQADRLLALLKKRVDPDCRVLKTIEVPLSEMLRQLGMGLSADVSLPGKFGRQSRWLAGAFSIRNCRRKRNRKLRGKN